MLFASWMLGTRCELNPWSGKIPWRKAWQPTPVFFPGESHGQRSLTGYSPWGRKRVGHDRVTKQQQQQDEKQPVPQSRGRAWTLKTQQCESLLCVQSPLSGSAELSFHFHYSKYLFNLQKVEVENYAPRGVRNPVVLLRYRWPQLCSPENA